MLKDMTFYDINIKIKWGKKVFALGIIKKMFKSYSEKEVKRIMPIINSINSLEPEMEKLSDTELKSKTAYFKDLLSNGKTLEDILPEALQ